MAKSDLTTFADAFPVEMKGKVSDLAASLVQSAETKLETLLNEPTLTGSLRGSRALESVSGGGLKIGWSDKAAIGVDVGRIQSQPYTKRVKGGGKSVSFARLLGSDEAPMGFTKPAMQGLRLGWEQVAQDAGKEF